MAIKNSELRVLVLDDHQIVRQVLDKQLREMGFEHIDMAENTVEARKKFEAQRYDIVFVDWILPGKSGYTLMQECRADRAYDDVAFVMVTSESEKHYMIEALKAGATLYITKPVMAEDFRAKVAKVLDWITQRRSQAGARAAGKT
jgi:two-component system chemotaxis response regulator CheY